MTNSNSQLSKASKLSEGLRRADLKNTIDHLFTVDQYQSKMGEDRNTIVLRFRANGKEPAIDLMEFIEKGYSFVLDSDMSAGEEKDGNYSVFIEIERTDTAPEEVEDLLNGINQLAVVPNWRFRWYKDVKGHDFDPKTFAEVVPLSPEDYDLKSDTADSEDQEFGDFFNQSATESITFDPNKNLITFKKAYSDPLSLELIEFGDYNSVKNSLSGGLQLDESSRGQVLFLNKYLGNYDINKIADKFLVRNGNLAVILSKNNW
jgi:hypothetical protein